jgi:NTE family protein
MPKVFTSVRRLITGHSGLIPPDPLAKFLTDQFPPNVQNFGELQQLNGIKAYNTAVCVETGQFRVFGDDPEDQLIDGAMSSSAVPPFYPPWKVGDHQYLDGGIAAKLPLMAAIERGATQIVALDIENAMGSLDGTMSMITLIGYSISMMTENQTRREIEAAQSTGIPFRIFTLRPPADLDFWDYDRVDELIELGRMQTEQALKQEPIRVLPKWQIQIRSTLAKTAKNIIP